MNEALEAKFILQFGSTIDEFITVRFIDSELFPQIIYEKFDTISTNYESLIKEAVEEIFDEVKFDEEQQMYLHPETNDEIYYDDWSDWWDDIRDEIIDELAEEFLFIIKKEVGKIYNDLQEVFEEEIQIYLQECIDDEWHSFR